LPVRALTPKDPLPHYPVHRVRDPRDPELEPIVVAPPYHHHYHHHLIIIIIISSSSSSSSEIHHNFKLRIIIKLKSIGVMSYLKIPLVLRHQ
jgi:hypothetical protein